MPITKRAVKKLRHDRVRTKQNTKTRHVFETAIKKARKSPSPKTVAAAYAAIDRSVKKRTIHSRTGARLKSRLAKLLKK